MKQKKLRQGVVFVYLFIGVFGITTILPFIYMILGDLMSYQEITAIPPTLIPRVLGWSNYQKVFEQASSARYFLNTFIAAATTAIVTLPISILGAFAMTSLRFRGRGLIQLTFLSLSMVPREAIIFTGYNTITHLGLLNTYLGLVLPFLTSILYMYYLQSYSAAISSTIYKAVMIDGASGWEYIWRILVPMSRGGLVTVALLSFISGWNSFLWPLLITNEDKIRSLNNGLVVFASDAGAQTQLQLATAILAIVPVLTVYFTFREQIIQGVVHNDLKV